MGEIGIKNHGNLTAINLCHIFNGRSRDCCDTQTPELTHLAISTIQVLILSGCRYLKVTGGIKFQALVPLQEDGHFKTYSWL